MGAIWFVFLCFVGAITCYKSEQALQCREDEVAKCVHDCPPERTCRNRLIQFQCANPEGPCKTKCVCKPGLYRNSNGECITEQRCEQCDKPNEYYACGGACDNVCSTLQYQNQTNCPIKNIKCNEWCYCDPGYARDEDSNCIPISECPPQCTEPNEEFAPCKRTCPPETCLALVALFNCVTDESCEPRCVCKPGYLRLKPGSPCMPSKQCSEAANAHDDD
ncbi:inducible metalloproteinase inhibitor protein-like [Hyposmocoma kahamanoa]|uniref:inducible metalloproteinase inhibitor protein-like n=1 Tax=Hyposmocoma kahamanoa TaxID=1477025 RepID=UPI000E6DA231|nr:inducible metalloproteinase inhibitor protein-like [Hyposmocoma kahamanoa]